MIQIMKTGEIKYADKIIKNSTDYLKGIEILEDSECDFNDPVEGPNYICDDFVNIFNCNQTNNLDLMCDRHEW